MAPSEERDAIVVDADDNILGYKNRHTFAQGEYMRISILWVEDKNGRVLLAQRALSKRSDPGAWGPAAAGTVEPNETYLSNIIKEAQEEIGLTLSSDQLREVAKKAYIRATDGVGRVSTWHMTVLDSPNLSQFRVYEQEVAQLAWRDKAELYADVAARPEMYVGSAKNWHELFPIADANIALPIQNDQIVS